MEDCKSDDFSDSNDSDLMPELEEFTMMETKSTINLKKSNKYILEKMALNLSNSILIACFKNLSGSPPIEITSPPVEIRIRSATPESDSQMKITENYFTTDATDNIQLVRESVTNYKPLETREIIDTNRLEKQCAVECEAPIEKEISPTEIDIDLSPLCISPKEEKSLNKESLNDSSSEPENVHASSDQQSSDELKHENVDVLPIEAVVKKFPTNQYLECSLITDKTTFSNIENCTKVPLEECTRVSDTFTE